MNGSMPWMGPSDIIPSTCHCNLPAQWASTKSVGTKVLSAWTHMNDAFILSRLRHYISCISCSMTPPKWAVKSDKWNEMANKHLTNVQNNKNMAIISHQTLGVWPSKLATMDTRYSSYIWARLYLPVTRSYHMSQTFWSDVRISSSFCQENQYGYESHVMFGFRK